MKQKFKNSQDPRHPHHEHDEGTTGGNLVAGLRQFHEAGPEMQRTISGDLQEMLRKEDPTVRKRIGFLGECGPYEKVYLE